MKKKAFIGLAILSLCFLLGGLYISAGMNRVVGRLQELIDFQKMHAHHTALVAKIKQVQTDLLLKGSPHAVQLDIFVQHGEEMATTLNGCFNCHREPQGPAAATIDELRQLVEGYQGRLSRVYTMRANAERLAAARKSAYQAGEELQLAIDRIFQGIGTKSGERTAQAQQAIAATRTIFIVLLTLGPLIVLLVSGYFFGRFANGVRVLSRAFGKIEQGELDYRITARMEDEFRQLADAFNNMGAALKEQCRQLQAMQQRYRMLFESAGDAIFVLEAEGATAGSIVAANRAAAEMHGYSVDELIGMHIRDLDDPAAAAEIGNRVKQILQGEWVHAVINHRKRDGSSFPVEISAGLMEYDGQRYILAFDRDVSERVKADEALQRSRQLALAGEMAAGLAHEIKNPLAGIKVSIEILGAELELNEEDREVFVRVIQEVNRIETLLKNLLSYARPAKPQFEAVDLNLLLGNAVKNAQLILKSPNYANERSKQIRFVTELAPELPPVAADASQLQQVFLNLLLNGIEAIAEAGTITVTSGLDEAGNIRVAVADSGKGFDEAGLAKAFQPFYTTKSKGSGLGLAISKRLIEQHHGQVELASRKGEGAVFTVTLPLKQQAEVYGA